MEQKRLYSFSNHLSIRDMTKILNFVISNAPLTFLL